MTATLTHDQPPTTEAIDVQSIPPQQRHALIFSRFGALATGQSLQLVNNHNPQPLRYQFDDRFPGQFEWLVLEAGPAVWRIQINRTAAATTPGTTGRSDSCCSGGACCG
jgi:uncharacterized protein (DUF2249 family)